MPMDSLTGLLWRDPPKSASEQEYEAFSDPEGEVETAEGYVLLDGSPTHMNWDPHHAHQPNQPLHATEAHEGTESAGTAPKNAVYATTAPLTASALTDTLTAKLKALKLADDSDDVSEYELPPTPKVYPGGVTAAAQPITIPASLPVDNTAPIHSARHFLVPAKFGNIPELSSSGVRRDDMSLVLPAPPKRVNQPCHRRGKTALFAPASATTFSQEYNHSLRHDNSSECAVFDDSDDGGSKDEGDDEGDGDDAERRVPKKAKGVVETPSFATRVPKKSSSVDHWETAILH